MMQFYLLWIIQWNVNCRLFTTQMFSAVSNLWIQQPWIHPLKANQLWHLRFRNQIYNYATIHYWHLIWNKQGNYKTNIPLMQVQHIWKRFMCNATIHFLHGMYFSNRRVIFYFSWSFTCVGTCKFRLSLILLVYQIAIILSVVLLQFVTINTYHKVKTRIWSVYWVSFN